MNAKIFLNFFSGLILSYLRISACEGWYNELYSQNSPIANGREYVLAHFVRVLSGRI